MGTSGSQRRGFRRTRAGAGGVPAVGGRGGVLVPQVARSAVSALRGWSGEPQKSVEIRWNGIGVVRGWSPPRTGQVCERISAQTPWIHPESKSGSEIALNARSAIPLVRRAQLTSRPALQSAASLALQSAHRYDGYRLGARAVASLSASTSC